MANRSSCMLGSAVLILFLIGVASPDEKNNIVAVVNDDIITMGEIDKLASPTIERLKRSASGAEFEMQARTIYKQFCERLINQRLMIQEGKRMVAAEEIEPSLLDRNVDTIIKDLIAQAGSLLQLKKILAKGGETIEEKKERTRDELLIRVVHQKYVRDRVSVTPREVREYYLAHIGDYTREKEVKSLHIFIPLTAHGSREKTRAFSDSLHQKIVEGADFAAIAKENSRDPHAANGGLWDFMKRPAFGGQIDEAMFSLNPGEISPVIETPKGFHILQVVDLRRGGKAPFEEVEEEIRTRMETERMNQRLQEFIAELRQKAYIKYR
ncbi:MAG: peptidylprolyl isomerase [Planctomycetota bacterium]